MEQYLSLAKEILSHGSWTQNRTGVDTITLFSPDNYLKIDLSRGFPLLTTKNMSGALWNSLVSELIWFISGRSDITELKKYTHIWDDWILDGENVGAAYPHQLRHYQGVDFREGVIAEVDQLEELIDGIKRNPASRRHVINYWNPSQVRQGVDVGLPPCHMLYVFHVQEGKLSLSMTQRSADTALGVPFNIASSALLTHLVARECNLKAGYFSHHLVNAHFYCGSGARGEFYEEKFTKIKRMIKDAKSRKDYLSVRDLILKRAPDEDYDELRNRNKKQDHIPFMLEQLAREPYALPELDLSELAEKSIFDLSFDDVRKIKLKNYKSHERIMMDIAV